MNPSEKQGQEYSPLQEEELIPELLEHAKDYTITFAGYRNGTNRWYVQAGNPMTIEEAINLLKQLP